MIRPEDESGDILPVLSPSDLLKGAPAAAQLVRERLELLAGEWWESPEAGNEMVDMLRESRFTEADRQTLVSYLASYIRDTPGVEEVRDAALSLNGKEFLFSCSIDAEDGTASVDYELLSSRPNVSFG